MIRWGCRLLVCLAIVLCSCFSQREHAAAGGGSSYDISGIELLVQTGDPQVDLAERYALAVLGANFNGVAHVAATTYYVVPWLRDSFAWGMIPSLRDSSIRSYSSTELEYWLKRQLPFGGWVTASTSGYFDETPILISAVLDMYNITGNIASVRRSLPRLERAWQWLAAGYIRPVHGSSWLIFASVPPHISADWADQIGRTGYTTQVEALWYWATRSLGIMEGLAGRAKQATYYTRFASHIRSDINTILWTNSAPYVLNAPAVGSFGHYRSWLGPRDYFELDSNVLCVVYGIANAAQSRSILQFIHEHDAYLLGLGTATGVPAKVLYGDYSPKDYAAKHGRLGPGQYQNGYWPGLGALVAIGFAQIGDTQEARAILLQLSRATIRDGDVREWYREDGTANGAPAFQWAARMFLVALYEAYLGLDSYTVIRGGTIRTGIQLHAPLGTAAADVAFLGRQIHVSVGGQGSQVRLTVAGQSLTSRLVSGTLLCSGCTLHANWQ